MALTFPIDTKSIGDIPEFSGIVASFSDSVPDLDGMLKYLCYRFDPHSIAVQKAIGGVSEKDRIASDLSGWYPPEASISNDDRGEPELTEEYILYRNVMGEFFWLLDNESFEFLCSLDITSHNANMIMRDPIMGNSEAQGKILLNVQKATENLAKARELKKALMAEISGGDPTAIMAITSKKKVIRGGISPEGQLRGNV